MRSGLGARVRELAGISRLANDKGIIIKQAAVFEILHRYTPPEDAMRDIYQFVIDHQLRSCIELGIGFGATTCVLGAAVEELGRGHVVTSICICISP